jgi:diguanylate cyclase (GGDEF)-like protein
MTERLAAIGSTGKNVVHELSDGRAIAGRPMPGGGWVTTHHDVTEERRKEARIAYMAHHDALTDLPNRALLNEELERALQRVKAGEMMAVHLVDLDHFKIVNDTQGHPAGDKLLTLVADRLRALRRETDTIARMGGDEFAIIQAGVKHPADAAALANRIIGVASEPYEIDGRQVIIGTSVGIAMAPMDGQSSEELMRNADLALYCAKGEGRGTFHFFEPDMQAQVQIRRALEIDLRKALGAGEFELHYQPTINLSSNEISGCEALLRWHHPERGMIAPATFIPLAEENGFIVPLGEWVIQEACATAARWPESLRIAVNLSAAQFRSAGLTTVIVRALATSGIAANRLELEITETSLLQDTTATLAVLHRLRGLGVRIALDDFGKGYSSLGYLQSFPFDRIKIDRSFITDIVDNQGSRNIVRAVIGLASGMHMPTTAEGVETREQLEILRAEGCTEMQGFLFSQARPAREIEQLLLPSRSARDAEMSAA